MSSRSRVGRTAAECLVIATLTSTWQQSRLFNLGISPEQIEGRLQRLTSKKTRNTNGIEQVHAVACRSFVPEHCTLPA